MTREALIAKMKLYMVLAHVARTEPHRREALRRAQAAEAAFLARTI